MGSPCQSSAACGKGLSCDFGRTYAGFGTCTGACDPFGDSGECQGGWCMWNGDATTAAGLCRSDAGGGVEPLPIMSKAQVAEHVLNRLVALLS